MPHQSAAEHMLEALVTVMEDFKRGGALVTVVSDASEPYLRGSTP